MKIINFVLNEIKLEIFLCIYMYGKCTDYCINYIMEWCYTVPICNKVYIVGDEYI